jgi:copper resistance protein B
MRGELASERFYHFARPEKAMRFFARHSRREHAGMTSKCALRATVLGLLVSTLLFANTAIAQEADHTPPDPPQQPMAPMSDAEMTQVMQMDDSAKLFMFKLDEFERTKGDDAYSTTWNAEAWYGGDFDKLWLRTEGERESGAIDARVEALWDHAFASFWDWQLGVRRDFGDASGIAMPARNWAAFGVQGLAPYWFEVEATAYLGEDGRTAARLRAEYEVLLSQRLILTPEVEFNLYGKDDRAREIASGLSDAELGLRLRYEIRREFAPYIGVVRKYRADTGFSEPGLPAIYRSETQIVAGFRLWF